MSTEYSNILKYVLMVLFVTLLILGIVTVSITAGSFENTNKLESNLLIYGIFNLIIWFKHYA